MGFSLSKLIGGSVGEAADGYPYSNFGKTDFRGSNNGRWKGGKSIFVCEFCGGEFEGYESERKRGRCKYCSVECRNKAHGDKIAGGKNKSWKGGRGLDNGYISIRIGKRQRKREHVLIAEKVLGRKIKKGEVIHHINGIKSDNRNRNLIICTNSYHVYLHNKMAKLYQQEHFGGL